MILHNVVGDGGRGSGVDTSWIKGINFVGETF